MGISKCLWFRKVSINYNWSAIFQLYHGPSLQFKIPYSFSLQSHKGCHSLPYQQNRLCILRIWFSTLVDWIRHSWNGILKNNAPQYTLYIVLANQGCHLGSPGVAGAQEPVCPRSKMDEKTPWWGRFWSDKGLWCDGETLIWWGCSDVMGGSHV